MELREHVVESEDYQKVGLSEPSVFGQAPQKGYTLELRVTAQVLITEALKLKQVTVLLAPQVAGRHKCKSFLKESNIILGPGFFPTKKSINTMSNT